MERPDALLLIGPTGAGKTPLGDALEARGLAGQPCAHFDFGRRLREIVAADDRPAYLSTDELAFLRRVLETGALLEDEHWPIAERILRAFLAERAAGGDAWVILNGLPRHVGQAEAVEGLVHVALLVKLQCPPEVIRERIRRNVGGDRAERGDDDDAAVRRKMRTYADRVVPLFLHYRRQGVPAERIDVGAETTAEDMRTALEKRLTRA
jgi:adenylate kinase family enzyme